MTLKEIHTKSSKMVFGQFNKMFLEGRMKVRPFCWGVRKLEFVDMLGVVEKIIFTQKNLVFLCVILKKFQIVKALGV